ncbi:MAG: glycosyltransferase family 2 protein [Candidatus Omnitrophica bacterium]|nr:glycosyltransferase family 2 protein [Candidatus Omnitrophota bacterium]
MSKCDIIIPVWNQPEVTRECVESIVKNTGYPYRLIVIDNGSDAPARDYLAGLKDNKDLDFLLIRNDRNLGFVKAVNQGLVVSDAPYLCIMNNDTIAAAGWLEEMIDVMEANPSIGLLNPSSNTSGQYPEDKSIEDYALTLKPLKRQIQELYTCRGFCMVLTRDVIKRVGLLDEIYHVGYFDDTDYCKRAQKLGYKTARAKAAYVYHKENVSFKALENNQDLFSDNEKIFFKRWGRHVRVGYFIDTQKFDNKVDQIATSVARNGHQIIVFMKKGLNWPVVIDHFDIRRVDLRPALFGIASIYKIFKRKKKKKLEVLLTDNEFFGKLLKMTRPLHGADVVINPDSEGLLKILAEKSKVF